MIKQLKHDNILPFYGVLTDFSNLCLVFPWYKNGNIMKYLNWDRYFSAGVDAYNLASILSQPHTLGAY